MGNPKNPVVTYHLVELLLTGSEWPEGMQELVIKDAHGGDAGNRA